MERFDQLHLTLDAINNVDVGMLIMDASYEIMLWNEFMSNHSGIHANHAMGRSLFELFPDLEVEWFKRQIDTALILNTRTFSSWDDRPHLFQFPPSGPISSAAEWMYQDVSMIPLKSPDGVARHLCLLVYDVTDTAINNLRLHGANKQLAELSRTDGLTGLYNRHYWDSCLAREFKRLQRTGHPCTLVMLDIDHFKQVNDTYGHPAGDEVIRRLGATIVQHKRETDFAGRYGGEEFAVILVDTIASNARYFAERLRRAIENQVVVYGDQTINFTISIGLAEFEKAHHQHAEWLSDADQALYRSKQSGRNRTTIYTPKLAENR